MSIIQTKIINGRSLAKQIKSEAAEEIKTLNLDPGLAIILVGNDPASHLYVELKEKACAEAGIRFEKHLFKENTEELDIISKIKELNSRNDIDAILIQLPLPEHLDEDKIIRSMDSGKDVDGFHPNTKQTPGLAEGIFLLTKASEQSMKGKTIQVISNSDIFSKPIYKIFNDAGVGKAENVSVADFVVMAVGKPGSLKPEMIMPGAVVIDVGTTRVDGKVVGDAADLTGVASAITPVPGGVGPMTVAMLIKNTVKLTKNSAD